MRFRMVTILALAGLAAAVFTSCQKKTETTIPQETAISGSNPTAGLEEIINPGDAMVRMDIPYEFETAGSPCWSDGVLYFTNNNLQVPDHSKTMKIDAAGALSVIRDPNGVTTSTYATGRGTFYCTEMVGRRVVEMGAAGTVVSVLAETFEGKPLDNPNDVTLDSKGGVYFSDSSFLFQKACVYYVAPDGAISRVIDDLTFPNGLELTPDEKTLIVVNTMNDDSKGQNIFAFDVNPDGSVSNKRVYGMLEMTPEQDAMADGAGGADGTAMDVEGNLYVATTKGLGVQVINSAGEHIGNIPCPSTCNNIAFGGGDMKTMYISALDGVYRLTVKIPGLKQPR